MNDKIKELAKQANCYLYDLSETHQLRTAEFDSWEDLEKFAKLIIGECAKIAEECYIMHRPLSSVPDTLRNFERILK